VESPADDAETSGPSTPTADGELIYTESGPRKDRRPARCTPGHSLWAFG